MKRVFIGYTVLLLLQVCLAGMPAWAQQTVSGGTLPRVIVLATGGTIAGQASERSAIGYQAGTVSGANLVAAVPGLDHLAVLSAEQIS